MTDKTKEVLRLALEALEDYHELVPLIPPKPKRKAAWKQNPLARFAPRSNT